MRRFSILAALVLLLATPTALVAAATSVELDLSRQVPVIEIYINDEGPFSFLVDTSLDVVALDASVTRRLQLTTSGQAWVGEAGVKGSLEGDAVQLSSVRVGSLSLPDVPAVSVDFSEWQGNDDLHGALGLSFFADHLLTLDYAGGRLLMEEGALPAADGVEVLDFTPGGSGGPAITIQVAGQAMSADLDSSRFGAVGLPEALMDELPLAGRTGMIGIARTPEGESVLIGGQLDGDVHIGAHVLSRPKLIFSDISPRANLGVRALMDYAVTFDQRNHRVRFTSKGSERLSALHQQAARVASLTGGEDLRTAFNAHRDKVRMLLILSPT